MRQRMKQPMNAKQNRRDFIRLASAMAALFAAGCGDDAPAPAQPVQDPDLDTDTCPSPTEQGWLVPSNPDVDLPHLGGAPDNDAGWSVAVFVDAALPGKRLDPTGAAGALDVGVPGLFFDPELPAASFVAVLAILLDGVADEVAPGKTFGTLTLEERDEGVTKAMEIELMSFALQLVKLGYYSSPAAACVLGYPGANPGYVDDPSLSFKTKLTEEVTTDGNYD